MQQQSKREWYDEAGRLLGKIAVLFLVLLVILQVGHRYGPLHRLLVPTERLEGVPMN